MAQEKRMASIIYRQNKWRAQVRKQGHRYFSKTFLYKDNARKWAHNLECEMDQGRHLLSNNDVLISTKYKNNNNFLNSE